MSDNDDKLAEYALKTLDNETARALATEIATSAQQQAALREIEDALTLLAEAEQPIAPSAQLRARVLNAVRQETRFSGFIERLCGFFDLPRETVASQLSLLNQVHAEPWQMNAFPGTHLLHFDGGAHASRQMPIAVWFMSNPVTVSPHTAISAMNGRWYCKANCEKPAALSITPATACTAAPAPCMQ